MQNFSTIAVARQAIRIIIGKFDVKAVEFLFILTLFPYNRICRDSLLYANQV